MSGNAEAAEVKVFVDMGRENLKLLDLTEPMTGVENAKKPLVHGKVPFGGSTNITQGFLF
jgi:hypothetical protein